MLGCLGSWSTKKCRVLPADSREASMENTHVCEQGRKLPQPKFLRWIPAGFTAAVQGLLLSLSLDKSETAIGVPLGYLTPCRNSSVPHRAAVFELLRPQLLLLTHLVSQGRPFLDKQRPSAEVIKWSWASVPNSLLNLKAILFFKAIYSCIPN